MDLHALSRRELQLLAKQHGLKANSKSEQLIKQLQAQLGDAPAEAEHHKASPAPPSRSPRRAREPSPSPRAQAQAVADTGKGESAKNTGTPKLSPSPSPIKKTEPARASAAQHEADEDVAPMVRQRSLLQSPGWARRRSSTVPMAKADANTTTVDDASDDDGAAQQADAMDARRVELIRSKVEARKQAARMHRTKRAEAKQRACDKVRRVRPTQPAVVQRCPGTHLGQTLATAAAAASRPVPRVPALERSPFVPMRSVQRLTEPVAFNVGAAVQARAPATSAGKPAVKALQIAEQRRLAEQQKKQQKEEWRRHVRQKIEAHHSEFAATHAFVPQAVQPQQPQPQPQQPQPQQPQPQRPQQPASRLLAPHNSQQGVLAAPRAALKQQATANQRRAEKVQKYGAAAKSRRDAKLLAARAVPPGVRSTAA